LDIEPESEEDEDAIIERRRQLRRAIEQKYNDSASATPQMKTPSPSPSSDVAVESVERTIKEELEEEGQRLQEKGEDGEEELRKEDPAQQKEEENELKEQRSKIMALRAQVRNEKKDMFSSEYFEEMHLVSCCPSVQSTCLKVILVVHLGLQQHPFSFHDILKFRHNITQCYCICLHDKINIQ